MPKKIVCFGGKTGVSVVLSGLNKAIDKVGKILDFKGKVFPGADFIKYNKDLLEKQNYIGRDLIDRQLHKLNPTDILVKGANRRTQVLHNSNKLAKIILKLCRQ